MPNPILSAVIARWSDPGTRPQFAKGTLATEPEDASIAVCRCPQGDILSSFDGVSDDELGGMQPTEADAAVADLLEITRLQARLIRMVNDGPAENPERVLTAPEQILGPHAAQALAFAALVEAGLTPSFALTTDGPAPEERDDEATDAARDACAFVDALLFDEDLCWEFSARHALLEIIGWGHLTRGPYFLRDFGFASLDAIPGGFVIR